MTNSKGSWRDSAAAWLDTIVTSSNRDDVAGRGDTAKTAVVALARDLVELDRALGEEGVARALTEAGGGTNPLANFRLDAWPAARVFVQKVIADHTSDAGAESTQ